mgnify:CR=1 FL=1
MSYGIDEIGDEKYKLKIITTDNQYDKNKNDIDNYLNNVKETSIRINGHKSRILILFIENGAKTNSPGHRPVAGQLPHPCCLLID